MLIGTAFPNWTTGSGVADTTNYVDSNHHTIQGGVASTQKLVLMEVFISGLAAASAPVLFFLGRTSTVGATLTAGRLQPVDANAVLIANPPVSFQISTTKPQRSSSTGMLLNLNFNAFGGMIRWYRGPEQFVSSLGNSASLGELTLSAFTGTTSASVSTGIVVDAL